MVMWIWYLTAIEFMRILSIVWLAFILAGQAVALDVAAIRGLLYPNSIPRRINPQTGNLQEPSLDFPLRLQLSTNSWLLICSEEITNRASDSYFDVSAVGVSATGTDLHIFAKTNITSLISNY